MVGCIKVLYKLSNGNECLLTTMWLIPWDMLCDMNDAEIQVDGDLFYGYGKPVIRNNA